MEEFDKNTLISPQELFMQEMADILTFLSVIHFALIIHEALQDLQQH